MDKNTSDQVDRTAVVAKSNAIIGALSRFDLSELRLLALCLSRCDSKEPTIRELTARVTDLCEIFPSMDEKSAYGVVKELFISMAKKPAEFVNDSGEACLYHWLSGVRYKAGAFTFCISAEMQPYLLGLKESFSQYRLRDVYRFRSAATWKLYENLAQWRTAGRWTVDLDELRVRLGVAGKYPVWKDLNVRVIAPAIAEINEHSDIRVEYHQEKRGRKVGGLVFMIDKQIEDEDTITLERPADTLEQRLLELGINAKVARDYADRVAFHGKTDAILAKLPKIVERAEKHSGEKQRYILGAIKGELEQRGLFDEDTPPRPRPDHAEALECWNSKRRAGEVCQVRERGEAGQRTKCKICLEKLPVDTWKL